MDYFVIRKWHKNEKPVLNNHIIAKLFKNCGTSINFKMNDNLKIVHFIKQ